MARAEKIHIARSAGIDEEAILGDIAPELMPKAGTSSHERRRKIRKTLDRIEREAGLVPAPRDPAARQAVAYAERRVGREVTAVSREPGWHPDRDESPEQMERTARELMTSLDYWQARDDAGLVVGDLESYRKLATEKAAILRERARAARTTHGERRFNVASLSPADRAKYGF